MRLLFFNWAFEHHGSAQDIYNYAEVARKMGHEVALYGTPNPNSKFNYSLDVSSADAVIFIVEFSAWIARLDALRLVSHIPRERRVVLDCDGKYNDAISVNGDVNHLDAETSRHWIEVCDSLSDKIFQPTYHPQQKNVRTFFFHAYNPGWELPLTHQSSKEFAMIYVGTNWFRFRPLQKVLQAIEPIREKISRIAVVGEGWDTLPERYDEKLVDLAHYTDLQYLRSLGVEVMPPIRFDHVVDYMSKGTFSPVIYRPLFDHLKLVTCRTYETPAANTIPIFTQDPPFVQEIFGDEALELVLPEDDPQDKILDVFSRADYYTQIVKVIRRRLAQEHSYEVRLRELIQIVES